MPLSLYTCKGEGMAPSETCLYTCEGEDFPFFLSPNTVITQIGISVISGSMI